MNCENKGGADADDDGQDQDLNAGRYDVAQNALRREGGLAKQAKGNEHEAGQCRELELDQGDEELDRQNEEGEQHHDPREQENDDLDEIFEKADVAHQVGDRIEERSAGIKSDLSDLSRSQEIRCGEACA
ncbi:hypothetical protein ACVIHC_006776 [Bradyrhizobium diazoefficiens]